STRAPSVKPISSSCRSSSGAPVAEGPAFSARMIPVKPRGAFPSKTSSEKTGLSLIPPLLSSRQLRSSAVRLDSLEGLQFWQLVVRREFDRVVLFVAGIEFENLAQQAG